jgi:outer membrane protein assembly factor BamD (BamD/ComL family)
VLSTLRLAAPLALAAALSAPVQCARRTPDHRTEDDPAEVLYSLAEAFNAQGNPAARAETLRFLIARYPVSRFAEAARFDLGEPAASPPTHPPPSPR